MSDPRFSRDTSADQFTPKAQVAPAAVPPNERFHTAPAPIYRPTMTDEALRALSSLGDDVGLFMQKKADEAAKEDMKAGREKALELAVHDSEAIKQGKLAPNQSKWFMKGYKSQYGDLLGQQWSSEAKVAWTQSDAKNSDDPNAASKFIQDFTYNKLKSAQGMDPDVREGLLPHLGQMRGSIMSAQAEYSSKLVYDKNLENIGQLISTDVDAYINAHGKMSQDELFTRIKSRDTAGRLQGVNNDDLNKAVVTAVTSKAREIGSTSMLDILKKYPTVGNNPKYLEPIRNAHDAIISKQASQASLAWTMEQRAIKRASDRAVADVYAYISDQQVKGNTDIQLPTEMKKALLSVGDGGEALLKATAFARQARSDGHQETAEEKNDALARVFAAGQGAMQEIQVLVDSKKVRDPATVSALHSIAHQLSDKGLAGDRLFLDPAERIRQLGVKDMMGNAFVDPKASQDAMLGYQREYALWLAQNPAATFLQKQQKSQELEKAFTDGLDKYKLTGGSSDYQRGAAGKVPPAKDLSTEDLLKELNKGTKK